MLNEIHQGDCVELLPKLADDSVHMTCFSPPYDAIRDYHGFDINLRKLGQELYRVTVDGGICACVVNDGTENFAKSLSTFRLAVDWVDQAGWRLFETCIYHRHGKPGGWWNSRFRVDHEYILLFLKGNKPRHFDKQHLLVPSKTAHRISWSGSQRKTDGDLEAVKDAPINGLKCRGTIWFYNASNNDKNKLKLNHPATYPDDLAADLIRCFSKEGDVILDPTIGSGTTAVMAATYGRQYIGMDISAEYVALAKERLERETRGSIL